MASSSLLPLLKCKMQRLCQLGKSRKESEATTCSSLWLYMVAVKYQGTQLNLRTTLELDTGKRLRRMLGYTVEKPCTVLKKDQQK